MRYKFKYLIFTEKATEKPFAQVNVSDLNKKAINAKWDELEKQYDPKKFTGCLQSRNDEIAEFIN